VLVATAGSLSSVDPTTGEPWTSWPTWPSFLPIVREILAYAAGGPEQDWQQLVGSALGGALSEASSPSTESRWANLEMVRPDGQAAPVAVQRSAGGAQWSYPDTDLSGIYMVRGLPPGELQHFAVNVDTIESDLTKINADDLPSGIAVRDTLQGTSDRGIEGLQSHSAWSGSLLWAAFCLLFLESFLAWQFGRGAT
jgi:hypothetical protein